MGGKNTPEAPPPVEPAGGMDPEMMMTMMQGMMGMMSSMSMPETPTIPDSPEVETEEPIDWTERNKQLAAKAKADYQDDERRKKGRNDTILTSPLLDEELAKPDSLVTG